MENQLYRIQSGFFGEKFVDQNLELKAYPQRPEILTNIHLYLSPQKSFQLDTLFVTQKSVVILEVKNLTGDLRFISDGDLRQLEQTLPSGKVTIMDCPIVQLENERYYLQTWLADRGVDVHVSGRVVLAGKNGKVVSAPPNAPLVYLNRLRMYLEKKESGQAIYSTAEVNKISGMIRQSQTTYNPFPLCEYYRIDPNSLKKGQLCSNCDSTMTYLNHKRRRCNACSTIEANNYRQTLTDWFMLISDSISNRQCRDFLQLATRHDANYALKTIHLYKEGKSVATRYYWPKGKSFKSEE
ncbi:nuclease-related domain-containing protein [Sporosarcina sp. G11-34]|uniref:nuclease-related domain-containing protein n=1 Tax=Sporosarcina sp. G11-34 TaxID=2849605 RepID=UPI0022A8F1F0|nr:nuclease-related domain-containing protein [Sporosarcina sp. G11-34]MCZ2257289.1 NERD domain-containing protein [Sporosarcina sp. G11-34]